VYIAATSLAIMPRLVSAQSSPTSKETLKTNAVGIFSRWRAWRLTNCVKAPSVDVHKINKKFQQYQPKKMEFCCEWNITKNRFWMVVH